jgi:hypothetical protein
MKRVSGYMGILFAILGLSFFIGLLARVGINILASKIRLLGIGFLALLLFSGARYALRTISWRLCVEAGHSPALLQMLRIMLVGEAFNDMSPAGPMLGDPVRVLGASAHMSAQDSATSVAAERFIYSVSVVLFLLVGAVLVPLGVAVSGVTRRIIAGLIFSSLVSLLLPFLLITRRFLLIGAVLDHLISMRPGWLFLERYEHQLRSFETTLLDFFRTRRRLFLFVLSIDLSAHLIGLGEVYFILKATGTPVPLLTALFVEMSNRVAQAICTFVPFGLGVEEGTAGAALHALGYGVSAGVSLGVIRKIRTMFWVAVGLLLATSYAVRMPANQRICEGGAK